MLDVLRTSVCFKEKLKKAKEEGNIGLAGYYEKEIEHFEQAKKKLET